jgi:hypothetical protein
MSAEPIKVRWTGDARLKFRTRSLQARLADGAEGAEAAARAMDRQKTRVVAETETEAEALKKLVSFMTSTQYLWTTEAHLSAYRRVRDELQKEMEARGWGEYGAEQKGALRGTSSGTSESRQGTAVSGRSEQSGTFRTAVKSGVVLEGGMASSQQLRESELPFKTAPEYAREIARELGHETNGRVWSSAVELATEYGLNGGTGQQPSTVAAGAVYLSELLYNEKRTQHEVAAAAGVSSVALRNAYLRIKEAEGYNR